MSSVELWFERKFDLSFPETLYPNICARLRGTPARLEELVRPRGREVLVRKTDGKWSMQEQAGHLLDLESLWLARVDDYLGGAETLTAADLTNRKTTEANHNARPVGEILSEFRKSRTALLGKVNSLKPAFFSRTALHPRLKTPLRLIDHLYFVAEHDDHHLAKIWELGN
jgi:hypothetical protein